MKRYAFLVILCYVLTAAFGSFAETSVSTGMHFDMFGDGQSPETLGYEVSLPLGVSTTWKGMRFSLKSNYGCANVYPAQAPDAKLHALTDTLSS